DLATRSMKDAETRLAEAGATPSVAPLTPAPAAEQAAYQALLKLRAREFEGVRNNRRNSRNARGGGGEPPRQQRNQLALTREESRYEDQRSARAQQERQSQRDRQQRETRQVLSRLKELARRQTDLNERLKELQAALEAAKDEKARAEIERQL